MATSALTIQYTLASAGHDIVKAQKEHNKTDSEAKGTYSNVNNRQDTSF